MIEENIRAVKEAEDKAAAILADARAVVEHIRNRCGRDTGDLGDPADADLFHEIPSLYVFFTISGGLPECK